MLPGLEDIMKAIKNGSVLAEDCIGGLDHDSILDARDGKEFSDQWMRASKVVEEAWGQLRPTAAVEDVMNDIRREAFMAVSRSSGQHEIASYVSDDFELIGKAAATQTQDAFILEMWATYCAQAVPCPESTD